jgi:hypothetical protein
MHSNLRALRVFDGRSPRLVLRCRLLAASKHLCAIGYTPSPCCQTARHSTASVSSPGRLRRVGRVVRPRAKGYSSWCRPQRFARFVSRGRVPAPVGLTSQQPMQEVSIAPASYQWPRPQVSPSLLPVRSVRSSSSHRWPNPSVKGTSCARAQAAPYVER